MDPILSQVTVIHTRKILGIHPGLLGRLQIHCILKHPLADLGSRSESRGIRRFGNLRSGVKVAPQRMLKAMIGTRINPKKIAQKVSE